MTHIFAIFDESLKLSKNQLNSAILKCTRSEVHCLDAVSPRECS